MLQTSVGLRVGLALAGHQVWLSGSFDDATTLTGSIRLDEDLVAFVDRLAADLPGFAAGDLTAAIGGLEARLTGLECRYTSKEGTREFALVAECRIGGKSGETVEFFVVTREAGCFAGLRFDAAVTLSNVPLFGGMLSHVAVDRFTVVYASAAVAGSLSIPGGDGSAVIDGPLPRGLSLVFTIESGESQEPIVFPLSGGSLARLTAAEGGLAKWFPVQKTFGPLSIQRVGAAWKSGRLRLMLDAAVTISALTIALRDLSLGFPLSAITDPSLHDLDVGLDGIGLSYAAGGVHISGGFLRAGDDYLGDALIEAAGFGLSAKGAYSNDSAGHPSLFAFVMLDMPLGGPPFFFVTGLAAGFGYNRSLRLPTLDALPQFPLVEGAISDGTHTNPFEGKAEDPAKALEVLATAIKPAAGQNWLAAGVRFTSFEMLQSFALASVSFGTDTEVALLGLSALTVPKGATNPIGYAQLALSATFRPQTGVLAVAGKLTPASYILSRACRLTGGFAFYTWFKDTPDGAHAGDFVITLGGYHPLFNAPPYYPQEPRLGVNWVVSSNLSVKGSFYFALTPAVVMGGGSLEAVWQSGDLRAWFNTSADFLLGWKPFHYSAHISLSLGASYTIDLLFTSATITVHLGVTLDLWGPSFAGKARVDLAVCSFTISFGDSSPAIEPVKWGEFTSSFMPPPPPPPARLASSAASATSSGDVYCDIRVTGGLLRDFSRTKVNRDDLDWVIDAEGFELTTSSVYPSNGASLVTRNGGTVTAPKAGVDFKKTLLGVGPMNVRTGALQSTHTVTLDSASGDATYDFAAHATATAVIASVPAAAWTQAGVGGAGISTINGSKRLIPNALTGIVLQPNVVAPDHTPLPISIQVLQGQVTIRKPAPPFWSSAVPAATDSFDTLDPKVELTGAADAAIRPLILTAILGQTVSVRVDVHLDRTAASPTEAFVVLPRLRSLGEERAR